MKAEEQAAWWENARKTINEVATDYCARNTVIPSEVTAEDLVAWCLIQRDRPRAICGNCGNAVLSPDSHVCDHPASRGTA